MFPGPNRFSPFLLVAALAALTPPLRATAGGLSCSIGEVVVENLKIGQTYSLQSLANLPLAVTNTGDQALRVSIEPLIPASSELRQDAEPIPDLGWASAAPGILELAPKETKSAALILTIPDDVRLFGRKFQVNFWSHSQPLPGDPLAYGLKSRVIFTIDRERELPGAAPKGDLSLALLPAELRLGTVAPGRRYRLETAAKGQLRVRNTSTRPLVVEMQALTAEKAGVPLRKGCVDLVQAAEVTLTPASFTLEPGEERAIAGTISVGKGKGLKGKDLVGVISASVMNLPVKTRIYSRISAHAQ